MTKILLFLLTSLWIGTCKEDNVSENLMPQAANAVSGNWKLFKISMGYPMVGVPPESANTYEEIISFDANTKIFTRKVDGKLVETSKYSLKETDLDKSIIFEDLKMYSTYSIDKKTGSLILYQSSPIGAILADGNSFSLSENTLMSIFFQQK